MVFLRFSGLVVLAIDILLNFRRVLQLRISLAQTGYQPCKGCGV
jgi:hypothetical protein